MRIGIDIMGGDYAPEQVMLGSIAACKELPQECRLVLIGKEQQAKEILKQNNEDFSSFDFVNAEEVIEMGEHPAKAFQKKTNSSIAIGFGLLSQGKIDSFASAGNTGAMLVGAMYAIKPAPGILRPCITAPVPNLGGGFTFITDVGLNADCKPEHLVQFAILTSIYAKSIFGVENPKVGLLNIGSEKEKGNILTQTTYKLLEESKEINFIGNVEGTDFFHYEKFDIMVCDGFVGNVVLKTAESFYNLFKSRKLKDDYLSSLNFANVGGTPVLGINSNVIIGHGVSNAMAIKNMILQSKKVADVNLPAKYKEIFK